MNIALFGKTLSDSLTGYLQDMVDKLGKVDGSLWIYRPFYDHLAGRIRFAGPPIMFTSGEEIFGKIDLFFSIGGDGTILEAVTLVGDSGIPIAGINMGHLGFLSTISKEEISLVLEEIISKKYISDRRTLLRLDTDPEIFRDFRYALNDVVVYKSKTQTMLAIKVWIDDQFLNTYWADGLIVATPTGSTAYSLSCTGPIITPESETFVITPIASHNLTVRPIIVRDNSRIRIRVEGKGQDFFVSLDSRVECVNNEAELNISKAGFDIRLIRMSNHDFFQTLREKLKWGLDIRN